jgi:hypothetical protein
VHLGGGLAHAWGVEHGFHHIARQAADFGGAGIGHWLGLLQQNRVAHAGDFQQRHAGSHVKTKA